MHTVVYPVPALRTGGTEQQLLELVRGLDKRRFHPIVVTFESGGRLEPEFRAEPGVEVVHLRRRGRWDLSPIWRLAQLMRSRQAEVVQPFLAPATSFAIMAGVLAGTRARILTERSGARTELFFHLRVQDAVTRFATCVVANSAAGRDCLLRRGVPAHKVLVIANGINRQRLSVDPEVVRAYRARLAVPGHGHVVGILASLLPVKDHQTFLQAAAAVSRAFPNTRFAVFGDGRLRMELVALAARLGLAERVTFFGTQQGVANCLSACDVLVSTSLVEGLSNAILEAMGLGVPVIATDIPGNREIVLPGRTGWLVPVRSPDVLASTLERVLTNTAEVSACVAQAKEMVATRFSLDRMVGEHMALYESLLTGRLRPALAPGA